MKNKCNIMKMILLLASVLLASCVKESAGDHIPTGEREVDMTFNTLEATRALIPAEDVLKNITLLVFDGSDATSKFLYSRYAWKTTSDTKFKTTLKIKNGVTIYFAANVQDLIMDLESNDDLVEGVTTWAQAKELLILDTPTGFDITNKGLPMWGHKFGVNIIDAPNNSLGSVNLLRSVASTDITVGASNFTLQKGHLVFAPDKGYLAYDPTLLSGSQVTGPQSPSGMTTSIDWTTTPTGVNQISNYFYMYDNATDLTPTTTDRPTRIILEGVWNNPKGSGKPTFYPLTFRDKTSAENAPPEYEKKQVTRNNKYLILVTSVNGDGWENITDAKDADDVNMDYDVIEWNQNSDGDIFIDGSHYISINGKEAKLKYFKSTSADPNFNEIIFTTNWDISDIKMTFTSGGTPVANNVSNDSFKAEVLKVNSGLPDEYSCFRFTALEDYSPMASDNPSTLYVTIGRVSFKITVTQFPKSAGNWEDGGGTETDL